MTKKEFIECITHINPKVVDTYLNKVKLSIPAFMNRLAIYCFVNEVPEDENTKILRNQIKFLDEHGYTNFEL